MTNAFNVHFECPTHSVGASEFTYFPSSSLRDFWSYAIEELLYSIYVSSRLLFYVGALCVVGELCHIIILKVNSKILRDKILCVLGVWRKIIR